MGRVNTVLGAVPAGELGITLVHEHVACALPGWQPEPEEVLDLDDLAGICAEQLAETRIHGVKTIIDATPIDLGRNVDLLRRVAKLAGINIVAATGLYTREKAPEWFPPASLGISDLCEHFLTELTSGIGGTNVKAGVIKVATGNGAISQYEEKLLRAAARAQADTGVPIVTHTEAGTMGVEQADLLISEGAEAEHIVIGHMCGSANLDYHEAVLKRNVYIAFDRFGLDAVFPDTSRITSLSALLAKGYEKKLLLSHDYASCWLGRNPPPRNLISEYLPNWSYTHIFRNVIPALKNTGISQETIDIMLLENPRRLFSGA